MIEHKITIDENIVVESNKPIKRKWSYLFLSDLVRAISNQQSIQTNELAE